MNCFRAELAVVGAGAAGLATALHALELGVASVVLLEKRPYPGGNAAMAGGTLYAAETTLQQRVGNTKDRLSAAQDILVHHRYDGVNAALIHALVDGSAFMLDWIQALGGDYCAHPQQLTHSPKTPSKDFGHFRAMTQRMADRFQALGGILLTQAAPERLEQIDGCYTLYGAQSKVPFTVQAKAVCVTTGGFLGNQALMDYYFPHLKGTVLESDAIPLSGDGVSLLQPLQVKMSSRCTINMHGMHSFDLSYRYPNKLGQESHLWVNRMGQRFVPEASDSASKNELGNAVYSLPGQHCYALFDQAAIDAISAGQFTTPQLKKVDVRSIPAVLQAEAKRKKWAYISEDWNKIATWMGADPITLRQTIEDYHAACAAGHDHLFGKQGKYLIPLQKPPYYAVKCVPVTIDTYGPLVIDSRFRLLDTSDRPIPGLFAAGVATAGWQGSDYYPRGSSLGFSLTGGLLAAAQIRQYLNELSTQ